MDRSPDRLLVGLSNAVTAVSRVGKSGVHLYWSGREPEAFLRVPRCPLIEVDRGDAAMLRPGTSVDGLIRALAVAASSGLWR